MHSTDEFVLEQLQAWGAAGKRSWLNMITGGTGSSPRPVGSIMACNEDGDIAGSLSGGCVEDDFIEKISAAELTSERPAMLQYGVSAAENERLGLPCGGRLNVLCEPMIRAGQFEQVSQLLDAIRNRRCIARTVNLADGSSSLSDITRPVDVTVTEHEVRRCFGPVMQMLLIGAGHMSRVLAELALAMDYRVLVCDPREHMRAQWTLNEVPVLSAMPDDAVRELASDPQSMVITLTHDPRFDDMALMEALTHPLFYIGALGSMRTTRKRLQRLRDLGLSEQELARLDAPVGLDIGSKTPMEIAISILGQITLKRRLGHSLVSPTLDGL